MQNIDDMYDWEYLESGKLNKTNGDYDDDYDDDDDNGAGGKHNNNSINNNENKGNGKGGKNNQGSNDNCTVSSVPVESDNWSFGRNPNCVFPFTYKGVEYKACTNVDDTEKKYWCANACDYTEKNNKRGICKMTGIQASTDFDNPTVQFFIAFGVIVMILGLCGCYIKRRRRLREEKEARGFGIDVSEFDSRRKMAGEEQDAGIIMT